MVMKAQPIPITSVSHADLTDVTTAQHHERTLVQYVETVDGDQGSGAALIPNDDSIPQITEGVEYMTRTITPLDALNRLYIEITFVGSNSSVRNPCVALFVGVTTDALACAVMRTGGDQPSTTVFGHELAAGVTTELTFRVRAGTSDAGSLDFNSVNGTRRYGGALASAIRIWETTPP